MIQKTILLLLFALVLAAVSLSPPIETQADTSFVLQKHTFSNGGGLLEGSQYKLQAVLGQPSMVGELSGSSVKLSAGYLAGTTVVTEKYIFLPLVIR